jgi:hypothetical protein
VSTAQVTRVREVEVQALDAARLEPLIGPERMARYEAIAEATQALLAGRVVFNVNSTAPVGESPRCSRRCSRMVAGPVSTRAGS